MIQNAVKITEQTSSGSQVTYLPSLNTHDFRTYKFENGGSYSVDGGPEYARRVYDNIPSTAKIENYCLDEKTPKDEIMMKALWGVLKNGKSPATYLPIVSLDLDHVKAIWKDYAESLGAAQKIAIKARLRIK